MWPLPSNSQSSELREPKKLNLGRKWGSNQIRKILMATTSDKDADNAYELFSVRRVVEIHLIIIP